MRASSSRQNASRDGFCVRSAHSSARFREGEPITWVGGHGKVVRSGRHVIVAEAISEHEELLDGLDRMSVYPSAGPQQQTPQRTERHAAGAKADGVAIHQFGGGNCVFREPHRPRSLTAPSAVRGRGQRQRAQRVATGARHGRCLLGERTEGICSRAGGHGQRGHQLQREVGLRGVDGPTERGVQVVGLLPHALDPVRLVGTFDADLGGLGEADVVNRVPPRVLVDLARLLEPFPGVVADGLEESVSRSRAWRVSATSNDLSTSWPTTSTTNTSRSGPAASASTAARSKVPANTARWCSNDCSSASRRSYDQSTAFRIVW